jgi:hypothetical protein
VVDLRPGEAALAGEIGDAGIAADLVDRAGQLSAPSNLIPAARMLERDHRGGDAALHVAAAATVQPAVAHGAGERVQLQPWPASTTSMCR